MCGLAPRARCAVHKSSTHVLCACVSVMDRLFFRTARRPVGTRQWRSGRYPEPTRAGYVVVPRPALPGPAVYPVPRGGRATGPPAAVYRRLGVRRAHGLTIEHTVETFVLTLKVVRSHSLGEITNQP